MYVEVEEGFLRRREDHCYLVVGHAGWPLLLRWCVLVPVLVLVLLQPQLLPLARCTRSPTRPAATPTNSPGRTLPCQRRGPPPSTSSAAAFLGVLTDC